MGAGAAPRALQDALALLGLEDASDESTVRAAFRERLRDAHPDLNADADATERTVDLTAAYRIAIDHLRQPSEPAAPPATGRTVSVTHPSEEPPSVHLVDAETLGVSAPAVEVIPLLVDAAHRLGDVTYLDPAAGLMEVVVEFVGAPTSSVVMTLQGRASGVTEVFCSVEPLSGGEAPSAAAVTQLLLRTLRGEDPTA